MEEIVDLNKKILIQAAKFENTTPTYSQIKQLCSLATEYQLENNLYFLEAKRGKKVLIKDEELFFDFISQTQKVNVESFFDLEKLLNSNTRAENIKYSANSKNTNIAVFDSIVLVKKRGEIAKLYKLDDLTELEKNKSFVAIENGETFLNIDKYAKYFKEEYFVYISGYANSLTREFLTSKNVAFFVDFDIEGMNIYESFSCKSKALHIPQDIETYFLNKKYHNVELYKKQRDRFKAEYSKEARPIIELIKKYNTVVEQEIIYEAS